jgi:hypothetical protein
MSEAFIICLNIERFRELLLSTTDDVQRRMLLTLIDEQERKLADLKVCGVIGVERSDPEAPAQRA